MALPLPKTLKMLTGRKAESKPGFAKPKQTKMATIKLPDAKPMTTYHGLSQFFGPKTTSEAAAEGRIKVATTNAASKRAKLKGLVAKKAKASTHATPYIAMPPVKPKSSSPF